MVTKTSFITLLVFISKSGKGTITSSNFASVHQLIELYNTILNSLEEKRTICCYVFCDFSKAFDKVWHKGLIHKMNCYEIKGNLLKVDKLVLH
jgi:hypothetical protein